MPEASSLASRETITAVHTQGKLLLVACGVTRGSSTRVRFAPGSVDGRLRFELRLETRGAQTPGGVATPYRSVGVFSIGAARDTVTVAHAGGEDAVAVLVAKDARALERREPVPLIPLASAGEGGRNPFDLAAPFEEMLQGGGELVAPPLIWPLRLDALAEGRLELAEARPRRATGYSDDFDFREAFFDALRNLPHDDRQPADTLTTVQVTGSGALIGGIPSVPRLFVSVLAY